MRIEQDKLLVEWHREMVSPKYQEWADNIVPDPQCNFPIFWSLTELKNRFVVKAGKRTSLYSYAKKGTQLEYGTKTIYAEPNPENFVKAIENGIVMMELDYRTNCGFANSPYKDHGPHLRCEHNWLHAIYDIEIKP